MKRIVITAAVHQKVKIAQVARDLGVSRSWASREANHPETQGFIAAVEKQDPETAVCSLQRALKAIADRIIREPDKPGGAVQYAGGQKNNVSHLEFVPTSAEAKSMPRNWERQSSGEHGVSLLAVALVGSVMFSFVGLALDLGRAFILRSELQTFVDTAALAAVNRLDGTRTGVQLAHTSATQGPLPTSAPNGINFGTTVVSGATDTYASTFTGTYFSYSNAAASTSNTYRFIQVVASSNLHLYFLGLVPGIGSEMTVSAAATAGQKEKPGSFSNGGLAPFAPIARDPYDTTSFGFTKGSKYTLKWDNHGATTCSGDAGFTPVGMPSAEHGFVDLGQGSGNSSLTGVIEYSGYPNASSTPNHVSVNDFLNDVTGNRGSAIFASLANRASHDSDQVSTTWAQYESTGMANGRRVITVVILDSSRGTGHGTNYASPVVGFGNFLLDPAANISGTSGPICATYLGPASSSGGTSGGTSGSSVYTTMLFR